MDEAPSRRPAALLSLVFTASFDDPDYVGEAKRRAQVTAENLGGSGVGECAVGFPGDRVRTPEVVACPQDVSTRPGQVATGRASLRYGSG